VKRALAVLLIALVAIGAATYVAGEQTEVVVVRTFDDKGVPWETKVWAVDHDGDVWVRVANPQRHWYRRLLASPRAELVRAGRVRPVWAEPSEDPAVRAAIDASFREKYGLVDWWYGVLLRRNPIPVRLRSADTPSPARAD
jgi:hypothetical protein